MKKLILSELLLLFLATTFISDTPPGWYQQTLPVNKLVQDIFFSDSLTGWVVASSLNYPASDTGYILKTTNGGNNWTIQLGTIINYYAIQFLDLNTGYAAGGTGEAKFLKTTNGGSNWTISTPFGSGMYAILDLSFVNKDTGWICSDDSFGGGVFKTTNGGSTWQLQLNDTFAPLRVFFINKDTGWVGTSHANGRLYNTTDGGVNWSLQFTSIAPIEAIFFLNSLKGWIRGGTAGSNGVAYTTDGGLNWTNAQGENSGFDVKFADDSIGYAGGGNFSNRITKSTDGGKIWGYQSIPVFSVSSVSILRNDTLDAWAAKNGVVHTTDGGGPITFTGVKQIGNEIPETFSLFQNYPNPFNPITKIRYQLLKNSYVRLTVFDINGKEVTELINQKQSGAGTYEVDFNGSDLSSGVYFYRLTVLDENNSLMFTDTKKMLMIK